ncbi:MAG: GHKL domain-containing protein [Paludibacteraceae bacterium]|jgi:signal transduction histidine kinase|nr:GHKL domain-containing protein [Paludibacteraceae bacterium]
MSILAIIGIICILIVVVAYFIHKRKLRQAREQQRQILTENISHELKTPVASIRGALETILMHPDMPEEQRLQFLERAYHQAGRLSNLVEDISTINKLDAQSDFYNRLEVDVYTIVENVVADLTLRATQLGATITHNIPKHLIISGNYTLLYSIFHNIVDNALNYVENAKIHINCTNQDPANIYFSIADNGTGVSIEALPHLFERFYRVDKGRSRKAGGTGLGLSIVKHAVLFHGGSISAHNLPDGGLEFEFSLARRAKAGSNSQFS